MKSDLYKIFTSDAVQGDASYISRFFGKCQKFLKIQPQFLANFWKFLDYTLPRPFSSPQVLCQMRGLMDVQYRGKFHLYSICGCEVKKFEMFSWRWSIHKMAHFWAFLSPNSPKCRLILLKFAPQLFLKESKTLIYEFFKNSNIYRNRTFSKLALFFSFCATLRPFFSMKETEIEKSKYFRRLRHRAIQKSQNQGPILSQFFRKNTITFCPILAVFWWKKGSGHTLKAWNQNLT